MFIAVSDKVLSLGLDGGAGIGAGVVVLARSL